MLVTTVLCWIFIVKFQQKNLPVLFVEAWGGSELYKTRAGVFSARTADGLQLWEGFLLLKLKQIITELSTILSKDVAEDLHH